MSVSLCLCLSLSLSIYLSLYLSIIYISISLYLSVCVPVAELISSADRNKLVDFSGENEDELIETMLLRGIVTVRLYLHF